MPPSDPAERLPTWVFVLVDAGLLGAAWYLAHQNPGPLSNTALLALSACVITGAAFVTVPLVLNYERKKNETLDERQRALEALAATVSSSAEQISIAAAGLHEIAALAQKNLQAAEFLPEKLRSQIAELGELIARTQDEEKAELQRELAALRTTESIRLEALSDKIAQSTAEWKSLETATRKHLAELRSNFAEIGSRPAVPAPTETARTSELTEKLTAALAAVEARLATLPTPAEASAPLPFDLQAALEADSTPVEPAMPAAGKPHHTELHLLGDTAAPPALTIPFAPPEPDTPPVTPFPTQKPALETAAPPVAATISPIELPAEPMTSSQAAPAESANSVIVPTKEVSPTHSAPVRSPRKRSPKPTVLVAAIPAEPVGSSSPLPDEPASLKSAESPEFAQSSPDEQSPSSAVAADGATRLIVTAYIGIGNRLFLRGEGPGLSWEKGTPLQFVSIGKWRWESPEPGGPIQFRIFKNDMLECTALGLQTLARGRQLELSATF